MFEKKTSLETLLPFMQEELAAGRSVQIKPDGESMLPFIRPKRDVVVLSPLPEKLKKYDLPLFRRDNGRFVLHRIVGVGQTFSCAGDNQFGIERGIRRDQMIALATAVIRDGKTYSVNKLSYRLFYRYWYYTRIIRRVIARPKYYLRRVFHV